MSLSGARDAFNLQICEMRQRSDPPFAAATCTVVCAHRRSASEQPKSAAAVGDDGTADLSGLGHLSSRGTQEVLRPVMSSDRDALEAELEVLRRQLSSSAVAAR